MVEGDFFLLDEKHDACGDYTFGEGCDSEYCLVFYWFYVVFETEVTVVKDMSAIGDFELDAHQMPTLSYICKICIEIGGRTCDRVVDAEG